MVACEVNMHHVQVTVAHLSCMLAQVKGPGTAGHHQNALHTTPTIAAHSQMRHLLRWCAGPRTRLQSHQEAQHTCHIQDLYLGVLKCIYKSFKGCKADAAEAHVHECTAQVRRSGVQLEKGCEA